MIDVVIGWMGGWGRKKEDEEESFFDKYLIDSIIHLAASLIIGVGEKYPKKYYKNNVLGTESVLSACKNSTVKKIWYS